MKLIPLICAVLLLSACNDRRSTEEKLLNQKNACTELGGTFSVYRDSFVTFGVCNYPSADEA